MYRYNNEDYHPFDQFGSPELTVCRNCGRRFYSIALPFCSATCADVYDRDNDPRDRNRDDECFDEPFGEGDSNE